MPIRELDVTIDVATGEVLGIADVFTGRVFRCFYGRYKVGDIVKGPYQVRRDPEYSYSRVLERVVGSELVELKKRLRIICRVNGKKFPPWPTGIWYRVFED